MLLVGLLSFPQVSLVCMHLICTFCTRFANNHICLLLFSRYSIGMLMFNGSIIVVVVRHKAKESVSYPTLHVCAYVCLLILIASEDMLSVSSDQLMSIRIHLIQEVDRK